jgi:hypothetical protein
MDFVKHDEQFAHCCVKSKAHMSAIPKQVRDRLQQKLNASNAAWSTIFTNLKSDPDSYRDINRKSFGAVLVLTA